MKKFLVVNYITTEKLVEADTREEAIEVALTMSPDTLSERTVVKRKIGDLLQVVQWILWKRSTKKLKPCWNKSAYERLRKQATLKSG